MGVVHEVPISPTDNKFSSNTIQNSLYIIGLFY